MLTGLKGIVEESKKTNGSGELWETETVLHDDLTYRGGENEVTIPEPKMWVDNE